MSIANLSCPLQQITNNAIPLLPLTSLLEPSTFLPSSAPCSWACWPPGLLFILDIFPSLFSVVSFVSWIRCLPLPWLFSLWKLLWSPLFLILWNSTVMYYGCVFLNLLCWVISGCFLSKDWHAPVLEVFFLFFYFFSPFFFLIFISGAPYIWTVNLTEWASNSLILFFLFILFPFLLFYHLGDFLGWIS